MSEIAGERLHNDFTLSRLIYDSIKKFNASSFIINFNWVHLQPEAFLYCFFEG